MPTINQLPVLNTISSGDQLPVYSPNNGDARRTSIGSLLTFFQQSFASPTLAVNLFVPGSGFNITVPTPVSEGQWMLLQPAGSLATGTITLPLNTGVPDGTTVLITSTQNIASLTIALNGASAIFGAVTSLTAGSATALRFYQPTNSWYQITAVIPDLASGIAAWLANPTSANLRAAMTDETGTGLLVFNNTPTLITPVLGTPTSGTLTNCTGLPNAGLVNSTVTIGGTAIALGAASSTIANDVTFNGVTVGRGLTSEATNTALGNSTLGAVTTAVQCTAVGASALAANTTGNRNTAVGDRALTTNTTGASNVAVGPNSLETNLSGNFNVAVGRSALLDNSTGTNNVAVGGVALSNNTTGNSNVAIGMDSQFTNTTSTGNISIGFASLYTNNSGTSNIGIGGSSLYNNTTGFNNIAVGIDALFTNTTGDACVAIGSDALKLNLTGQENIAVGFQALENVSVGSRNTAVGFQALNASTSSNNVAVGHLAMVACTSGTSNTAIGRNALGSLTSGSGNTGINPSDSFNAYVPVFNVTTENDRFVAGSTSVTNAYIQVPWTVVSDARDKIDFAPVPHGLDFVTKLKPTTYRFKAKRDDTEGHGPLRYGFLAQDVMALEGDNPVIVDAEKPEKLKFNDQSMIAVLVNAIQELKAEFDAYKATHP
jgi:hypothetical protein